MARQAVEDDPVVRTHPPHSDEPAENAPNEGEFRVLKQRARLQNAADHGPVGRVQVIAGFGSGDGAQFRPEIETAPSAEAPLFQLVSQRSLARTRWTE